MRESFYNLTCQVTRALFFLLFLQLLNLVEILPTKQRGIGTGVLFSGIVMLVLASSSEIGLNFGVNNFDFFEDYHICVMFLACQTLSTGLLKTVEKFSHFQGSLHHTTKEQASALAGLRNTNTHQKIDSTIPLQNRSGTLKKLKT